MKPIITRKEYLELDGCICPYCKSEQIEGGSIEIESGSAYQKMGCLDCDSEWIDVYNLDRALVLRVPDGGRDVFVPLSDEFKVK